MAKNNDPLMSSWVVCYTEAVGFGMWTALNNNYSALIYYLE